jgi:hypothetical protein
MHGALATSGRPPVRIRHEEELLGLKALELADAIDAARLRCVFDE